MTEARAIKKYPNRCLYDTEQSKYISLADLKKLVVDGVHFEVREVKTDKDITRQVLMQIIAEEEEGGTPLFTTDVLERFIRMYGGSMQGVFSEYMSRSLANFDQQARAFLDQMGDSLTGSPMSMWSDMAKKNLDAWQEIQKNMMRSAGHSGSPGNEQDETDNEPE